MIRVTKEWRRDLKPARLEETWALKEWQQGLLAWTLGQGTAHVSKSLNETNWPLVLIHDGK